jgi:hypothetical protein
MNYWLQFEKSATRGKKLKEYFGYSYRIVIFA